MIPLNKKYDKENPGPTQTSSYKMEYYLEIIFDKFSKGLRYIGPVFAFALTLFVFVVTHAFFQIILPYWINKTGMIMGFFLALLALYLLFSILFNYFLSVLVRPGSLEDILKSRYYRKVDPLEISSTIVNLKSVFLNKNNIKEDKRNDKVEVKMRLKADNSNIDGIEKENQILNNANNFKISRSEGMKDIIEINDHMDANMVENINEINDTIDSIIDDRSFTNHLENKLQEIPSANLDSKQLNDNYLFENKLQEKEINEYHGLNLETKSFTSEVYNSNNAKLSDCKYCKLPKPIRAHHCSICGSCVLKMDHHCPWINNCVGQNNHRYFVLFLTHLMFGCLFVCLTSIPIVFNTKIIKSTEFNFVSVLSFVGLMLMIFFNSWNWFLVLRGNTTIEFWTLKANILSAAVIKDFSLSNWRENVFLVFGTQSLLKAVFIPSIKKLPLSGLEWTKMSFPSFKLDVIDFNKKGEELRISSVDNEI